MAEIAHKHDFSLVFAIRAELAIGTDATIATDVFCPQNPLTDRHSGRHTYLNLGNQTLPSPFSRTVLAVG
jgi:hypothetical protein